MSEDRTIAWLREHAEQLGDRAFDHYQQACKFGCHTHEGRDEMKRALDIWNDVQALERAVEIYEGAFRETRWLELLGGS